MKSDPTGGNKPFWDWTGLHFPDLAEARSTRYYRESEERLFEACFGDIEGKKLLKTDLWDEAKNTRILRFAADRGAKVFGIDISVEMIRLAAPSLGAGSGRRRLAASDVRAISFADGSFDLIYSMGTIEHSREYEQAVRECFRVLKRGGTAVIGVPNARDPFLRPLLVAALNALGLYAYGYEKSFSMRKLVRICEDAGFEVRDRSGILFLPGWLRMAELWVHVRSPRAATLFAPAVAFFAWLNRKIPRLGRYGYLIACSVRKP